MRRKSEDLRGGLQQAALEWYRERVYDQTTTSEIAARAGPVSPSGPSSVTLRTGAWRRQGWRCWPRRLEWQPT